MKISALTSTQVWAASARSLTNFGSSALTSSQITATSIAGAASVDLRPSIGIFAQTSVTVFTGAAATANIAIQHWDGTNAINMTTTAAAANSPAAFFGINGNSAGMRIINNDATHAGSYIATSILMTQ